MLFKRLLSMQIFGSLIYLSVLASQQEEGFQAVNWVGCLFLTVCLIGLVSFDLSKKKEFLALFK